MKPDAPIRIGLASLGFVMVFLGPMGRCLASQELVTKPEKSLAEWERATFDTGEIGVVNAAPIGYFLIVRKGRDACAIRFTGFAKSGKSSEPTVFSSGDITTYAEYDWYFQEDGSLDFTRPNVKSGHDYVKDTGSIGIGRLAFKPTAKQYVECGPFAILWSYPNGLSQSQLWRHGSWITDKDIEAAPTGVKEVQGLVLDPNRLRWSRYGDTKRERIPLDQLPFGN